jgi:hypothetical protein
MVKLYRIFWVFVLKQNISKHKGWENMGFMGTEKRIILKLMPHKRVMVRAALNCPRIWFIAGF